MVSSIHSLKIAFIISNSTHYQVPRFEILQRELPRLEFFFYTQNSAWYQLKELGYFHGRFTYTQLWSLQIGRFFLTPGLLTKLWNYDIYITTASGYLSLPMIFLISRLRRKPFILRTGIWHRINTPLQNMFFPVLRYIYTHADAIVTYGSHVDRFLMDLGVKSDRLFPAKHAADNDVYNQHVSATRLAELRQQHNIPANHQVVLYVGRLVEEKGLDYLFDAYLGLARNNVTLLLVGSGAYEDALREKIQQSSSSNPIVFVGFVSVEQVHEYYALADIFVLPSITTDRFKEPWGLVVNEAFNQGTPSIATDAVGAAIGGLVQDGINGYIIPERDSAALQARLETLLNDDDLREQFGQAARDLIVDWTPEALANTFLDAIAYVTQK